MNEIKSYSLSDILTRIKNIIDEKTSGKKFWLKAEISNINIQKSSGHCYIELVETKDNIPIAQCKATIWASNLLSIRNELKSDFDNILKKGNEFLCLVEIKFHQLYGLQFNICKVDMSFSLGNLEKIKQETIERLKREGVFELNKLKIPPVVIKKIALITSISTNAYDDFYKQINNNKYGYQFEIDDFNVTVQGESAVNDIYLKLEYLNNQNYDIIAIIRGGGSKLDLDVFNNYTLAKTIATHNLPVYTGIGHENDVSIADMVASMQHKTPTALGAHIVEKAHNFEVKITNTWVSINEFKNLYFENQKNWLKLNIQSLTSESTSKTRLRRGDLHTVQNRINTAVIDIINLEKRKLTDAIGLISSKPVFLLTNKNQNLKNTIQLIHLNFQGKIKQSIDSNNHVLELIATLSKQKCYEARGYMNYVMEAIQIYHPNNIMKKGYAIPRYKGILFRNQLLRPKEELEIEMFSRTIVVSFIKSKEHGRFF